MDPELEQKLKEQKVLIVGGAVILLIIILLLAQPGPQPVSGPQLPVSGPPFVLETENAKLEIPPGALPPGFDASQIYISNLPPDTATVNGEPAVGYTLGPDGLQFAVPVNFTLELETGDVLPIFFQLTDEGVETVDNVTFRIEGENLTASAYISHFSGFLYNPYSGLRFRANAESAYIGEKVEAEAELIAGDSRIEVESKGVTYVFSRVEGSSTIRGYIKGDTPVTPLLVADRPPKTAFGERFVIPSKDFECMEDEYGILDFVVTIRWRELNENTGRISTKSNKVSAWNGFLCVEEICGDGRLGGDEECDLADDPVFNKREGAKPYTCKKGKLCNSECKCVEPFMDERVPGVIEVTKRECRWIREGAYTGGLLYYCKWYVEYTNGSNIACTDVPVDATRKMLKSDGNYGNGLIEIVEETDERTVYTARGLTSVCPEGGFDCDCSEKTSYIMHGNHLVLDEQGDMSSMWIGNVNPTYLSYDGDGDVITLIHPGVGYASSEWVEV